MSKHAHDSARITQFLIDFSKGNRKALDEMLPLVYNELKRVAKHYLSQERSGHTLQTTALVHEAYIRMLISRMWIGKTAPTFSAWLPK